jgi:hypothetical protein
MATLTVHVAASRCPRTGAAGWAAVASRAGEKVADWSGVLKSSPADKGVAAMAAAANGLAAAVSSGMAIPGDRVQLVCDSREVAAGLMQGDGAATSPRTGKIVRKARQIAASSQLSAQVVLRRHPADGPGAMAMALATASTQQAARRLNPPVLAYRNSTLSGKTPLPLERFQSIQADESGHKGEACLLRFACLQAVPEPSPGSVGLACALWKAGACEARHVSRVLEASLAKERSTPDGWALALERVGLAIPGAWSHEADEACVRAGTVGAAEAASMLMARCRSPHSLECLVMPTGRAGEGVLARILMMAGCDGVSWRQRDGTLVHVILDPSQVEPSMTVDCTSTPECRM